MSILDYLLFNVDTIAKIPQDKRINTANEYIEIENNSSLQWLRRWQAGDNRQKAVRVVSINVRLLMEFANRIMESRYLVNNAENISDDKAEKIDVSVASIRLTRRNELRDIAEALEAVVVGIDNLCKTYEHDQCVRGQFTQLLKEISNKVSEIKLALK